MAVGDYSFGTKKRNQGSGAVIIIILIILFFIGLGLVYNYYSEAEADRLTEEQSNSEVDLAAQIQTPLSQESVIEGVYSFQNNIYC